MTTPSMTPITTVGLLGFGEVGAIFGHALAAQGLRVSAWDKLLPSSPAMHSHAQAAHVNVTSSAAHLCQGAQLLISAVTAANTLAAAQSCASHISPGSVYLDLNSASPGTKQACADIIEAAGAHYVEAGVMTSVPPHGIAVPMLLGGAHAQTLCDTLAAWGCQATVVSDALGVASAIKMCRSIMVKGLEALVIESYTAARSYGVEDQVPSLALTGQRKGAIFSAGWPNTGNAALKKCASLALPLTRLGLNPPWPAPLPTNISGWPTPSRTVCLPTSTKTRLGKPTPMPSLLRAHRASPPANKFHIFVRPNTTTCHSTTP